ncbi:hypothetical protein [Candidatus Electrothrix sp.]|uniref:hypothetical protein n=1 Tax=Candidatus Electrothrix sp. TaxID=2170559 RepID=UPI0040578764
MLNAHLCRYITLLTLCLCTLIIGITGAIRPSYAEKTPPLSLTVPIATLHQNLNKLLPLPIEPQKKNHNFQGQFVVDSISQLRLKKNVIAVQGQLSGKNMTVNADVGGQTIQIQLGEMVLPVSCDIALRYDKQRKTLFLKPTFYKQARNHDPAAASLGPLLDNLSKEYALPLDTWAPLAGSLGNTPFFVQLEPVDIRLGKDTLVFQFLPHASKTRPGRKTKK